MDPTTDLSAAAGISIALAGSGGSGVMTAGNLLLDAAAQAGAYGLMVRTSGPQIRGGEAGALVRLARGTAGGRLYEWYRQTLARTMKRPLFQRYSPLSR